MTAPTIPTDDDITGAIQLLEGEQETAGQTPEPAPKPIEAAPIQEQPRDTTSGQFVQKAAPATVPEKPSVAVEGQAVAVFTPPKGGEPFKFRADGTEVTVDGALRYPEGVWIPNEVWEQKFRPGFVANRESWISERRNWQQREQGYQQHIQGMTGTRSASEMQAKAIVEEFSKLLDEGEKDPAIIARYLDNFVANRPMLEAQMAANVERQKNEQLTQQMTAMQEQQFVSSIRPAIEQHIPLAVDYLFSLPDFQFLAQYPEAKQQLQEQMWNAGERLYWVADQDLPHLGIQKGQLKFNEQAFVGMARNFANLVKSFTLQAQATQQAAQRNQAAVAPTTTSPSSPSASQQANKAQARPAKKPYKSIVDAEDTDPVLPGANLTWGELGKLL